MIITYCVFVDVGSQYAMHMCCIFICDLPSIQHFSPLSKKGKIKKNAVHKMCVLISFTTFV